MTEDKQRPLPIYMTCKAINISKEKEQPRWLGKDIAPKLYDIYIKGAKELSHGYCPECGEKYKRENKM